MISRRFEKYTINGHREIFIKMQEHFVLELEFKDSDRVLPFPAVYTSSSPTVNKVQ